MSFIRTFHPIGQGAFYTEQHHDGPETLTVVYDCGSLTAPRDGFLRKVATALPPKSVIDLLFISHFHADHINGLDELKRKYTIRTVVLPELTEEARVLVKLENYLKYDGFSSVLVDDPQAYFSRKTLIIQIAPVGDHDSKVGVTGENDNGPFIDVPAERDEAPSVPNSAVIRTSRRMQTVASGTPIRLNRKATPFWEYVPFNYEIPARRTAFLDMLTKLKIEVSLLSSLEKVIARKKALSKAYHSLDGDLNENSLVVYSGALGQDRGLLHKSLTCTCWHPYYYSKKEGCLYLGDTDLTLPSIVGDLQQRLLKRWPKIQTIQVPHHGSIKNFNTLIVEPDVQAVISYGTDNKYGHPSAHVLGSLHRLSANPLLVTEQLETIVFSYSS